MFSSFGSGVLVCLLSFCFVLFYFSLLNLVKTFQKGKLTIALIICAKDLILSPQSLVFRDDNIYHELKCMELKIAPCHSTALLLNGVKLRQDTSLTIEFTGIFQDFFFSLSVCTYLSVCLFI